MQTLNFFVHKLHLHSANTVYKILNEIISPVNTLYKKIINFPVPSRDVTYQTLPGRE